MSKGWVQSDTNLRQQWVYVLRHLCIFSQVSLSLREASPLEFFSSKFFIYFTVFTFFTFSSISFLPWMIRRTSCVALGEIMTCTIVILCHTIVVYDHISLSLYIHIYIERDVYVYILHIYVYTHMYIFTLHRYTHITICLT